MPLRVSGAGSSGVTGSGVPGAIPVWVTTTEIGSSTMAMTSGGDITIGTDPNAAATETLRFSGGLISDTGVGDDNTVIGRGAVGGAGANARNVAIGRLATVPAGATEAVVIGYNSSLQTAGGSSVIVGAGNQQGPAFPTPTTVIGANNTFNNAFSGPGVGTGSSWQGSGVGIGNQQTTGAVNNWVAIGRSVDLTANHATAIGDNVTTAFASGITLGSQAVAIAANMFLAGAQNVGITQVLFGEGDTNPAPAAVSYRHTNASGSDVAGANVTFIGSRSTGNNIAAGRIDFQTGTQGASGSALQAAATRFRIRASDGTNVAPAVEFVNAPTAAAAAAGTLLNAPVAGNPTVWIPCYVDNVRGAIPFWAY